MKKNNLVPKNNSSTQEIVLPINHEKLSEALRQDMRQAAEYLLPIHKAIGELPTTGLPEEWSEELLEWLEGIGAALEALDCIEHIPVMNELEAEIDDAIESAIEQGLIYQVDPTKIENTNDELIDECERINELINDASDDEQSDYLIMQYDDLSEEVDRRQDAQDDILENLVQDAIESGDTAVLKHDESECRPDCGGFSGCACEDTYPVCDDCGRKNCICDGGFSVWSGE